MTLSVLEQWITRDNSLKGALSVSCRHPRPYRMQADADMLWWVCAACDTVLFLLPVDLAVLSAED